jgi:hypothetical protein
VVIAIVELTHGRRRSNPELIAEIDAPYVLVIDDLLGSAVG